MDAIEAARRRAASIHAAALEQLVNPWRPLDLVLAEVARADLAAEAIEPGAHQLDGALAKFLPDLGLILYEDRGDDFYRAFLIAHELGHALLGDAGGPCSVDETRPGEIAADGEERVVAHGPRQRREIQMDLFARELLLPRPWVRELHLAQGLTSAEIAERMRAPPAVVAQQLLDALLLPMLDAPNRPRKHVTLNRSQIGAAAHRGSAYLLEAGPGTGKTQTLVARVASLLAKGVDPRQILVLTYSNRAAAELSDRIAGDNADALAAMWIGTFHAFGYDVLHAQGDAVHRGREPQLIDRAAAIELMEHEIPRLDLTRLRNIYDPAALAGDVLAAIARAQDEFHDPDAYAERTKTVLADAAAIADAEERAVAIADAEELADIATIYHRYEALKRERYLVDFGDLVILAARILEDPARGKSYRDQYQHVLVDEYQDVNRTSVRLLQALRPTGDGLWAVGDARQSIYRFRGASSRNMVRFRADFPGATGRDLVLNYRSRPEIVDLVTHFGAGMRRVPAEGDPPPRPYEPLGTLRGKCGVRPELQVVRNKTKVSPAIAATIGRAVAAGGAYRDHCVLVSGNDRLADIGRELEALGIPILFLGSLFERDEVRDLLALLSLVTDPWAAGLLRVGTMPEFRMALSDVVGAMDLFRAEGSGQPRWIDQPAIAAELLSPEGFATLAGLATILRGFHPGSDPWTILTTVLLDRTRIAARLAARDDVHGRAMAIATWQFLNFVRAQHPDGAAIPALLARVRRLVALGDERDLRQLPAAAAGLDAVRMSTIHGAKGLEFHTVHLPGLNHNTLPHDGRRPAFQPPEGMIEHARGSVEEEYLASRTEEQDCLFYVALSRAEERLHLYRCSHKVDDKPWGVSEFIARLGTYIDERTVDPEDDVPPAASALPVPIILAPMRVAAWQLDTFEACPRKFLYLYLLRVGGGGATTPYRRMHDIVRDLCVALAGERDLPAAAAIGEMIHAACDVPEITGHGYQADLLAFAVDLVTHYVGLREGHQLKPAQPFELSIGSDAIVARPHEILLKPDGTTIIRIVRTGHSRTKDGKSFVARTLVIRAGETMPGAIVELVHLADRSSAVALTTAHRAAALDKAIAVKLGQIRAGLFPPKPEAHRCANCPAFTVCDALPAGEASLAL